MSARPDPKTLDDLERTAQALLGPGVRLERAETEARCWNDLAAENERLRAALANAAQIAEGTPAPHRSGLWFCDGDPINPRRLWTEDSVYHSGRVDAAQEIRAAIGEIHEQESFKGDQ